jgi:hypothetical protein
MVQINCLYKKPSNSFSVPGVFGGQHQFVLQQFEGLKGPRNPVGVNPPKASGHAFDPKSKAEAFFLGSL